MKNIKVVIGANFGDEGKGLITDYLCARPLAKCLNVLTNGGAQRAHTVDTKDGQHHVFQHFGSGTFAGADTFFSWRFIINPMQFHKEYDELSQKTIMPKIYYDLFCFFSTPWDMILNQIVEDFRGDKKHGSCGMGIWETVVRQTGNIGGQITVSIDTFNSWPYEKKFNYLQTLRDNYFINRLHEYALSDVPESWKDVWFSDTLISNFIYDIDFFVKHTIPVSTNIRALFDNYDNIVFENGQGLLLDQNSTFYDTANTTPSNTGSIDAYELINSVFKPNEISVELCYVSRTYMTRHGAGRFITECDKSLINKEMFDHTNLNNQFQGSLRYGELIEENLRQRIIADAAKFRKNFNAKTSVYLTHTNEFLCDIEKIKNNKIDNIFTSDTKYRESVKLF